MKQLAFDFNPPGPPEARPEPQRSAASCLQGQACLVKWRLVESLLTVLACKPTNYLPRKGQQVTGHLTKGEVQ
jgi:hypothetical protein